MSLVYDLVNQANDNRIEEAKPKRKSAKQAFDTENKETNYDTDGSQTKKYLKNTKDIIVRISSSSYAGSLGLHPAVYVYAGDGRYQNSAFMAVVELIKHFERHNLFEKFTMVRGVFEDFLVNNKILVNQVVSKYGSGIRSYKKVFSLYLEIINLFIAEKTDREVMNSLLSGEFFYLEPSKNEFEPQKQKDFSSESKSIVFIRRAFESPLRCSLCNGYVYSRAFNIDHIQDKKYGGIGNADNGQITHFYCNSIKDKGIFSQEKQVKIK